MLVVLACFSAMTAAAAEPSNPRDANGRSDGQLATNTAGNAADSEYEYVYKNDDDEYEYVYENDDDEYEYVYENDDDEYDYAYENDDDEYEYARGDYEYFYGNGDDEYYYNDVYGYNNEYFGGDYYDYDADLRVPILNAIAALKRIRRARAQRRARRD